MITLQLDNEPVIGDVTIDATRFIVHLQDGRSLTIPYDWYPRLAYGTLKERENWELFGNGYGIHWPDLDEDLAIDGILAGNRSAESSRSLGKWLSTRTKAA